MKVAFIITVYKNDKLEFFKEAIESIVNQDYGFDNINIYLGIDGEIPSDIREYIDRNNIYFYKIIQNESNKGLAFTLNRLIAILEDEEYIFRMDSDDICKLNRVSRQVEFMEKNKEVDIAGSFIEIIDENNNSNGQIIKFPKFHDECFRFFEKRDPVAHPSVVFRKTYFKKAGLYPNSRKNQDTLYWAEGFLNNCKFANVDEVLLSFRMTNEMLKRRSNIRDLYQLLVNRYKINFKLKYGPLSYIYATMYFILQLMPYTVRRIAYKYLR
jgi:hypothetical protein